MTRVDQERMGDEVKTVDIDFSKDITIESKTDEADIRISRGRSWCPGKIG